MVEVVTAMAEVAEEMVKVAVREKVVEEVVVMVVVEKVVEAVVVTEEKKVAALEDTMSLRTRTQGRSNAYLHQHFSPKLLAMGIASKRSYSYLPFF